MYDLRMKCVCEQTAIVRLILGLGHYGAWLKVNVMIKPTTSTLLVILHWD